MALKIGRWFSEDEVSARNLKEINVLDHAIVDDDSYFSFSDEGIL